ncbi:MAG: radical SAM protein [bacterium]
MSFPRRFASARTGPPEETRGLARPEHVRKVLLILTSQCNLRCGYCFQNAKRPGAMSWEVAQRSLDLAVGSDSDDVEVTFFGGEPLIEFETIRRSVAYVEERRRAGHGIRYSLSTNGLLFTEEILEFLGRHAFQVQWSFDGVPAAQALRGRGTFDRMDAWLSRLMSEPAFGPVAERLRIALTLVPRNVAWLADSIDYFLEKSVHEITIGPAVTPEPGWRVEGIAELEAQFDRILESMVLHRRRTGEVPLLVFGDGPIARSADPGTIEACGAASGEEVAVDVDGQAHSCGMFADSTQRFRTKFLAERVEDMRLGDLRAPEFGARYGALPEAAVRAGIFSGKERKRSSYGRCGECAYLAACSICPVSIANAPGNEDPDRIPDFPCAYNLVALKHRDAFWARVAVARFPFRDAALPAAMLRVRAAAAPRRSVRGPVSASEAAR